MSELFVTFWQHLVWSLILWVLIFTAFTAVFARGRLIAFAAGLGRVLASIVATPFRFIHRAVAAVLGHSDDAEARYRASDQYVLNKGMLLLQAVVIVLAIGALSAAVILTWNALVPPSEVRRDAKQYAGEVEIQREKAAKVAAEAARLDNEWAPKEQGFVASYRQERNARIAGAARDMASIETDVQAYAGTNGVATLQRLRSIIDSRSNDTAERIHATKNRLDSNVSSSWYWLGEWGPTLSRWNELWEIKTIAELELATLSIPELRALLQPSYPEIVATRDREADTLRQMEQILLGHQEAASLKWKAAFVRALASFATFLLFVWTVGALIEAGWMAIHIADDVRRIRQERAPSAAAAVSSEALIPIRDVVAVRGAPQTAPGHVEA